MVAAKHLRKKLFHAPSPTLFPDDEDGRVEWVWTGRGGRVCTDLRWDGGRVEWIRTGRGAECALTCVGMGVG